MLAAAERTPVWLMRQAGRYMADFRECASARCRVVKRIALHSRFAAVLLLVAAECCVCGSITALPPRGEAPCQGHSKCCSRTCRFSEKYPFRMRSETAEIAIELSMQPWNAFRPDGVIMFSDILTPLPAMGIEFDVVRGKGPIIQEPIRRCCAELSA